MKKMLFVTGLFVSVTFFASMLAFIPVSAETEGYQICESQGWFSLGSTAPEQIQQGEQMTVTAIFQAGAAWVLTDTLSLQAQAGQLASWPVTVTNILPGEFVTTTVSFTPTQTVLTNGFIQVFRGEKEVCRFWGPLFRTEVITSHEIYLPIIRK